MSDHLLRQRVEDFEFLLEHGVGFTEAAKRIGTNAPSLRSYLKRNNQSDLLNALANNDH